MTQGAELISIISGVSTNRLTPATPAEAAQLSQGWSTKKVLLCVMSSVHGAPPSLVLLTKPSVTASPMSCGPAEFFPQLRATKPGVYDWSSSQYVPEVAPDVANKATLTLVRRAFSQAKQLVASANQDVRSTQRGERRSARDGGAPRSGQAVVLQQGADAGASASAPLDASNARTDLDPQVRAPPLP